jgi:hypothetical protein
MVEPPRDERVERVLACMPKWAVAAIVAQCDSFRQGDVEAQSARYGPGDLCYLQGMREAGPLVVVREDEDLGLARQATKSRCLVQDPVAVALEAGPPWVRALFAGAVPGCL